MSKTELTWQDYQDISFWPRACVVNGRLFLETNEWFHKRMLELMQPPKFQKFSVAALHMAAELRTERHQDAMFRMRLAEHQFIMAAGQVANTFEYVAEHLTEIRLALEAAPHIRAEAAALRNMREHIAEYARGKGRRKAEFVRESSTPISASADASASISSPDDPVIGNRLNVKLVIQEAEALRKLVSQLHVPEFPLPRV